MKKRTVETNDFHFGTGRSDKLFLKLLRSKEFWNIDHQKQFQEFKNS